jgi:adenylate cyclase
MMHILLRGDNLQLLRLVSGLILFIFALTHFLNTALGLVSLEQMDAVDRWRVLVIRSTAGTVILATALVVHILLAFYKVVARATWRMPVWEAVQLGLGLLIPFLLFPHIVNTRIANNLFGVVDNYLYELARLWPANAILQSALLLMVWVHGSMGIHYWLRLSPAYRAVQPVLLFLAIIVPLAALAGFMVSGRIVAGHIENAEALARVKELTRWPNDADNAALAEYRTWVRLGFLGVLALIGAIFGVLYALRVGRPKVVISYAGGPRVAGARGQTLLEISRANGIPHASVCGGRSRCSTCRVRIEEGAETLPRPVFPESVTLAAIEAPENVRLACQIRPLQPLVVTRLIRPASASPEDASVAESDSSGTERPMAVLTINLREFNEMSARRLPYDVVFLLNQFFSAVGTAIRTNGGFIDKFVGDGVIAVFGQRHGVEAGCRQALRTMRDTDLALDALNASLAAELGRPMQVAAGLHAGPLILGRIGYGEAVDLTVIGTAVKVALELETIAKDRNAQLALSRDVAVAAGWALPQDQSFTRVTVRGHPAVVEVFEVERGRDLDPEILAPTPEEQQARPGRARAPAARADAPR